MRKELVKCRGCAKTSPNGSKTPWMTMSVSTVNCGNEDHVDGGDHCEGIGMWHESDPPGKSKNPNRNNHRWFFCFPNIEVYSDGGWKKGVAIRLQHGTVVGWDGRCIRHCTSVPSLRVSEDTQEVVSNGYGTWFGIDQRVTNCLRRNMHPDLRTREGKKWKNESAKKRKVWWLRQHHAPFLSFLQSVAIPLVVHILGFAAQT